MSTDSLIFPKSSSDLYRHLLQNLAIKQKLKKESSVEPTAESIITKSFCDELNKLAFGKYIAETAGHALLSQGISEGMNRLLNGPQAGRSAEDFIKDTGKSVAFHLPFAALAKTTLPGIQKWTDKPNGSTTRKILGNTARLGVQIPDLLTNPYMHPGYQIAGQLIGHALT